MNPAAAVACGLLPGFAPDQVLPVGNTALAGAFLALVDSALLAETRAAATRLHVLELNLDPGFESHFIDQLSLPSPLPLYPRGEGKGEGPTAVNA